MAETFDTYEKLKDRNRSPSWRTVEDKADAAMDLTELLEAVQGRVKAFVLAYEADIAEGMAFAAEQREKGTNLSLQIAHLAEKDLQTVAQPFSPIPLMLDDLKILLDRLSR